MKLTVKHDDISTELSHGQLQIGKESGYTPLELFVSSIAGCSAIVFRTILEKKRIPYDVFTIETEIGRSEVLPRPVESMHLHYKIKAKGITQVQLEKALELAVKNCTIAQSVKESIKITETIELIENE
ncbi:osmotically inducible protein C [Bacillus pseudomycoides]|uniref:Osmotically inducible protein C n=1 Tax=Bacillus pseudomycoides TaxID=64104 RepID=A0AA91ZR80_9BACI|nr:MULTISPECIES: OsmC family protein [Bacillus]PEB53744.1 osmotically inducible protein C [Bacillus sp. AFS098217]PED80350.1 osmotically inducible protein C [Bacillus pseudomycoides]PEU10590.1 osmotically inducible protein C [Bacillus sp. AFS019443]PEU19934.1 osmotically inducible protein C [Bacillus sp. AFS014408]PFW59605.1 osmotically inducible protein C [Bacillus sp. AFS075034]